MILSYATADQPAAVPAATAAAVPAAVSSIAGPLPRHRNGPTAHHASLGRLPIKAAPSVRHLARKLNIDLSGVQGTGPEGRILLEDVSTHLQRALASRPGTLLDSRQLPATRPDYGKPGTRIKLVGMRRAIAEHMVLAKRTIPHYTYVEECEVTDLVKLRESLREPFARLGVKLTYLPFFVKAVVAALKEVPIVNATLEESSGEIVLHDRYNVGIAVATPAGLMVPVIHDADRKDLATIARDIERLSGDARLGKSRREELKGSTFTITNVGNLGGLFSAPVINHPEVGILGLGKIVKRPVFDEHDNVRPAHLIYLSLSFDHRVVDGAVGAAFTNVIVKQMQNPAAMLVSEPAGR